MYELRDGTYLELIAERGGDAAVLMVVGHNSATETTASLLCHDEVGIGSFPTGAIAVMDVDIADWTRLQPGSGRLVHFLRPPKG